MRSKDQILLESIYDSVLLETRNSSFLRELNPLLDRWKQIQSNIKGKIPTYSYDPEGEPYDAPDAGQKIDKKDLPIYYQDKKYNTLDTQHPSNRRVYGLQTDEEISLEKELLRVYQKYADQEYFNKDVLLSHDFGYSAHATNSPKGVPNREGYEEYYLKNENNVHKDVLSCSGRDLSRWELRNIGSYGIIVKGRVLFASTNDLASQTFRTIPQFARDYFKNSGVPKRAAIDHVHFKQEEKKLKLDFEEKKRKLRKEDPLSEEEKNEILNKTVLDKRDSPFMAEVLLGNWRIEGWFFSHFSSENKGVPFPYEFWKKAYENKIQKPVYYVPTNETQVKLQQVDLNKYFNP